MRPKRLVMSGFGSFHDKTEVDFSDLGLAAIVGSTGAGKSTIIDGVTFALYGRVARHSSDQLAPIINQKAQEAKVLLEFEAGDASYVAARTVLLAPSGGGAKTKEARLERSDGLILAGRASEMSKQAEGLLGLNFEQFTKTVVLPQGEFARFLHDRDRQRTLRQLLDLDVYSLMGEEARKRATAAAAARDECDRQIAAAITVDEARRLAQEASNIKAAAEESVEAVARLDDAVSRLRSAQSEETDLAAAISLLEALNVPEEAAETAERAAVARSARDTAETAARTAADAARSTQQIYDNGPDLDTSRQLIRDYRTLADLAADTQTAHDKHQTDIAAAEAAAAVASAGAADAEAADAGARASAADADNADTALQAAAAERSRISRLRGLYQQLRQADTNAAKHHADLQQASNELKAADDALDAARSCLAAAEEALADQNARFSADRLAAELELGQSCPVCGQDVHELRDLQPPADLTAAHETSNSARSEMNVAEQRARLADQRTAETKAAVDHSTARQDETTAHLSDAETETELDTLEAKLDKDALDVRQARTAASADAENARHLSAAAAASAEISRQAEATAASSAAEATTAAGRRDDLAAKLASTPSVEQAIIDEATAVSSSQRWEEARRVYDEAAAAADTARQQLAEATEEETQARVVYTAARDSVAAMSPPAPNGDLLTDWQKLASWSVAKAAGLAAQRNEILNMLNVAQTDSETAREASESLCGAFIDTSTDPSSWPAAMAAAAAAAAAESDIAAAAAETAKQTRRRSQELAAHHHTAEMLGRLLQKDGFQRWLMEAAISSLAQDATHRLLELSEGRFSLAVLGGDFKVVDHHNADEERDAKSLSGGETFLASLALALSLAERQSSAASATAPGLGALFIDEGFGTLDPETLDTAACAIETLGASGRMVCVVTHIREFADRMPVRFEVTRDEITSRVTRSGD